MHVRSPIAVVFGLFVHGRHAPRCTFMLPAILYSRWRFGKQLFPPGFGEGTLLSEYQHIHHGFDPVFDARSHVLVLGSFPSVLSRENNFYYGSPRNRFWQVIAACTGRPVPLNEPIVDAIASKQRLLLDSGIALWDVIESCDIKGSADSTIRNAAPAHIERILDAADIKAIIANGRTAEKLYRDQLQERTGRTIVCLPSTSPANAAYSLDRLIGCWKPALQPYL